MAKKRNSRFIRPKRPKKERIALTDRDLRILRFVAEHRFLRSQHLAALLPDAGRQGLVRRLQDLWEHGYLDRPRRQTQYYHEGGGSKQMVYGLGNKGAAVLREHCGFPQTSRWADKNREAGELFLAHRLEVADFMVALERECRARGGIELIQLQDILRQAPDGLKHSKKAGQWRVQIAWKEQTFSKYVEPDKIFGLRHLDKPEGANRSFFFLEVDRGTMTVVPKDLRLTKATVLRKLINYAHTRIDETHKTRYGLPNFRVLFVTTSKERVESFIDAHQRHTRSLGIRSSLFLFADKERVTEHGILSAPWLDGKGNSVRLAD